MKIIEISPGEFKTFHTIPKTWKVDGANYENFHLADPSLHYQAGFRDLIYPPYNSTTQKLGGFIWVGDDITYEVIDLSDEEVKSRITNNAQAQKEQFTRLKLEKQIESELQALTDDAEVLENQQGYPLWSEFPDGYSFTLDTKVQDFEGLELKIYKVLQAHNKQSDWQPINVPALFVKVLPPGAALIWEAGLQVTVGQQYEYQGTLYEVIQAHTTQIGWEPPNVPSLWTEVI